MSKLLLFVRNDLRQVVRIADAVVGTQLSVVLAAIPERHVPNREFGISTVELYANKVPTRAYVHLVLMNEAVAARHPAAFTTVRPHGARCRPLCRRLRRWLRRWLHRWLHREIRRLSTTKTSQERREATHLAYRGRGNMEQRDAQSEKRRV